MAARSDQCNVSGVVKGGRGGGGGEFVVGVKSVERV
jgi:hypothetical protein